MEFSSSHQRNEQSCPTEIDQFAVPFVRAHALESVLSVDILGLADRVRAARETARSTWSAPQVAGYLLAYLDRIPGFEIDEQTASDAARGVRSRHGLIEACSTREDIGEADQNALKGILHLLNEAYEVLVEADDVHDVEVVQAFDVIRQEVIFSFGIA